jgi:hypothetical protein
MTKTDVHNKIARQILEKIRINVAANNFTVPEMNVLLENVIAGLFYALIKSSDKPMVMFGKIMERLHAKLVQHLEQNR